MPLCYHCRLFIRYCHAINTILAHWLFEPLYMIRYITPATIDLHYYALILPLRAIAADDASRCFHFGSCHYCQLSLPATPYAVARFTINIFSRHCCRRRHYYYIPFDRPHAPKSFSYYYFHYCRFYWYSLPLLRYFACKPLLADISCFSIAGHWPAITLILIAWYIEADYQLPDCHYFL